MVTKQELENRLASFIAALGGDWDTAFIVNRINQYYFTGTIQDGLLVVKKNGQSAFFVRRSYERARLESPLENIYPMRSYRDAAALIGSSCGVTYLDTETATIGLLERMKKHFDMSDILPVEGIITGVRAIKSPTELALMEQVGKLHHQFLAEEVPNLLREGMTETEFTALAYKKMLELGHHGVTRFNMYQNETVCGQMGFGVNALYPTNFDGSGGMLGLCPAAPAIGNRETTLKKGDIVFVDYAFGMEGYHTDKTVVYSFGAPPPEAAVAAHRQCMDIQNRIAAMLKPGNTPAGIYTDIMDSLDEDFKQGFPGFGNKEVAFLGHGIGLHIDEAPALAKGFNEPLAENMVFAVEPKKGIEGIGLLGAEDTYVVTPSGGRCITGTTCGILTV